VQDNNRRDYPDLDLDLLSYIVSFY
jgi:hypothetical protein